MRGDTPCRRGLPVGVYPYHLIVEPIPLRGGLKRVHLGPILDLFYGLQKWFSMFYSWLELRGLVPDWDPQRHPLDTLSETS